MRKQPRTGHRKNRRKKAAKISRRAIYRRRPVTDVRGLVDAIFAQRHPVAVAVRLLDSDRPTVAARVLERLLEYRFGRPKQMIEATGPGGGPVRVEIISHIPRPERVQPQGSPATDSASPASP